MDFWFAVVGVILFVAMATRLARLVARDGLGTNPLPRSHRDELGSWVDRELGR